MRFAIGFISVFIATSCAPRRNGAVLKEVHGPQLHLTAKLAQVNARDFRLEVRGGENPKVNKLQLTTLCAKEFELGSGKRFGCKGPGKADLIQVVYQETTKKGAIILQAAQIANGQRLFLTCFQQSRSPFSLTCDSSKSVNKGRVGLVAPFPSTVTGLNLPNAHVVWEGPDGGSQVLRGMAPATEDDFKELVDDLKIEEVLIYKDEVKAEVKDEAFRWRAKGMDAIHHKPFKYHGFPNFQEPCTQTLESIAVLTSAAAASRQIFFHCTVGEDRTGMLAGLFRLLHEKGDVYKIFIEEMCENGYAEGDPGKPDKVVAEIRNDLTPVFLKLAYLIKEGRISSMNPKESVGVCNQDPATEEGFKSFQAEYLAGKYSCKTSTKFLP